jgi:hypothetical protein
VKLYLCTCLCLWWAWGGGGGEGVASYSPSFCISWWWVVSFTLLSLYCRGKILPDNHCIGRCKMWEGGRCTYKQTRGAVPATIGVESNEYYTTFVCVFVALGILHAMRMRHLSSVACRALQYFSALSHKQHDFRKKLPNTKCVLFFSTTSIWNISHSKKKRARYDKNIFLSSCKVPVIFVQF